MSDSTNGGRNPYDRPSDPAKRHSRFITDGPDRAPARAMLKAVGFTDEDLARPLVGVATTWIETMPCNLNQRELAQHVKAGIRAAGGTPMEFNTVSVSDGVTMGAEGMRGSLVSREVIADSIELFATSHALDGVIALSGCDKTIPATAMALARMDVPGLVLYGGPILHLFGQSFAGATTALTIVATAELVNAATGTCQGMIDMTGHVRVKLANTIASTVLLIGGGAILIPPFGVIGAATATLIAVAGVNIASLVEVWVLEGLHPFDRDSWKLVAAGCGAYVFGSILRSLIPVGVDFVLAAVQGAMVGLVYVGIVLSLGLAADDRMVIGRALGRIGLGRVATWRRLA